MKHKRLLLIMFLSVFFSSVQAQIENFIIAEDVKETVRYIKIEEDFIQIISTNNNVKFGFSIKLNTDVLIPIIDKSDDFENSGLEKSGELEYSSTIKIDIEQRKQTTLKISFKDKDSDTILGKKTYRIKSYLKPKDLHFETNSDVSLIPNIKFDLNSKYELTLKGKNLNSLDFEQHSIINLLNGISYSYHTDGDNIKFSLSSNKVISEETTIDLKIKLLTSYYDFNLDKTIDTFYVNKPIQITVEDAPVSTISFGSNSKFYGSCPKEIEIKQEIKLTTGRTYSCINTDNKEVAKIEIISKINNRYFKGRLYPIHNLTKNNTIYIIDDNKTKIHSISGIEILGKIKKPGIKISLNQSKYLKEYKIPRGSNIQLEISNTTSSTNITFNGIKEINLKNEISNRNYKYYDIKIPCEIPLGKRELKIDFSEECYNDTTLNIEIIENEAIVPIKELVLFKSDKEKQYQDKNNFIVENINYLKLFPNENSLGNKCASNTSKQHLIVNFAFYKQGDISHTKKTEDIPIIFCPKGYTDVECKNSGYSIPFIQDLLENEWSYIEVTIKHNEDKYESKLTDIDKETSIYRIYHYTKLKKVISMSVDDIYGWMNDGVFFGGAITTLSFKVDFYKSHDKLQNSFFKNNHSVFESIGIGPFCLAKFDSSPESDKNTPIDWGIICKARINISNGNIENKTENSNDFYLDLFAGYLIEEDRGIFGFSLSLGFDFLKDALRGKIR